MTTPDPIVPVPADHDPDVPWPPPSGTLRSVERVVALGRCADCGWIHSRCKGHRTRSNKQVPCRVVAMRGQLVCGSHGGRKPAARTAGLQRVAKERALGEIGGLLAEALEDAEATPVPDQMLAGINRAYAMMTIYTGLLAELDDDSEWSFETNVTAEGSMQRFVNVDRLGLAGPDQHGNLKLHPYEEALRHWTGLHGRLVKAAADIGLEERRTAIEEQRATIVVGVIRHIVDGLGRALDDPEVVPVVESAIKMLEGQ